MHPSGLCLGEGGSAAEELSHGDLLAFVFLDRSQFHSFHPRKFQVPPQWASAVTRCQAAWEATHTYGPLGLVHTFA